MGAQIEQFTDEYNWTPFTAAMTAEGADGYQAESREEWVSAFQYLIDNGMAWQLQGWFGRTAMDLIANGDCTMPAQ